MFSILKVDYDYVQILMGYHFGSLATRSDLNVIRHLKKKKLKLGMSDNRDHFETQILHLNIDGIMTKKVTYDQATLSVAFSFFFTFGRGNFRAHFVLFWILSPRAFLMRKIM